MDKEKLINIVLSGYYGALEAAEKENGALGDEERLIFFNGYIAGVVIAAPNLTEIVDEILESVNITSVKVKMGEEKSE